MTRSLCFGIFFLLWSQLPESLQLETTDPHGVGILLPGPELDCSKYFLPDISSKEKPVMSGRNGWNGVYTDINGVSRQYSWKAEHEKVNTFYFNCTAKYPIVFRIVSGLEKCFMSKDLKANLEYRHRILKKRIGIHPGKYTYTYQTWAPVPNSPNIVGVFCRGVCNNLKTEAYYFLNSYKITGYGTSDDSNPKNGTIEVFVNPVPKESSKLKEICSRHAQLKKGERGMWERIKKILSAIPSSVYIGMGIIAVPVTGILLTMIVGHLWFTYNCSCRDEDESNVGRKEPSVQWFKVSLDEAWL